MTKKEQKEYIRLYKKMAGKQGVIENFANEEQNYKNLTPEEVKLFKKLLIKKNK